MKYRDVCMRRKIPAGEGADVLIPKSKGGRRRKRMDIPMHKFKK
jgi:hypothetical protein